MQAIGVLGAVRAVLLIILAELVGAALIDTFGLFGRPVLPLNPGRIAGLLLVLGGALLTLQAGT
ncbi:DMT family transporter [Deinococcus caeni]|uniref:DMT family transporter n=1 Tax=Deinococcus caeni TaxID=569127 RepID=UPI00361689C1